MRKFVIILLVVLLAITVLVAGCGNPSVMDENEVVERQQNHYNKTQPVPFFDYSLDRDLMTQLYTAKNKQVSTWTQITDQFGNVRFETPSQGYPIPADVQLTNPLQALYGGGDTVVEQPEPNGLFSSKNTDATYIMALNPDGTFSPIYTELKTTAFPFPVEWVKGEDGVYRWKRVEGAKPTITLTPGATKK